MPQQGVEARIQSGSASKLSSTAPSFEPNKERNLSSKKKSMNNSEASSRSSLMVNFGVARESLLKQNQTQDAPKGANRPQREGSVLTSPDPTTGRKQPTGVPSPYTQHQIDQSLARRNSMSHAASRAGMSPTTPHSHGGMPSSFPHQGAEFRRMSCGLGVMMPSTLFGHHPPPQSMGLYPGLQPQHHLMMGGIMGQAGCASLHNNGGGVNRRRDSHDSTGSCRTSHGRTRRKSSVTSDCVWVGNVCPTKTDDELKAKFEELGPVLTVRRFSRSHCAFIQFKSSSDAGKARMLENQRFGDMNLTVNIGQSSRHLWCGNVADGVTERDLVNHFGKFGQIQTVKIFQMNQCAFVNFVHEPDARRALNALNNTMFHGNRIVLNYQWTRRTCLQKRGPRNRSQSVDEKSLESHRARFGSASEFSSTRPIPPQVSRGRSRSNAGRLLVSMAHGPRERFLGSMQKMADLQEEDPGKSPTPAKERARDDQKTQKENKEKDVSSTSDDKGSGKDLSEDEFTKEEIKKLDKENSKADDKIDKQKSKEGGPGTSKQTNDKKREEMSVTSLRVDTSLVPNGGKPHERTMKVRVAAASPAGTEKEKVGGRVLSPRTVQQPRAKSLNTLRRGSADGSNGNTPRDDDSQGVSNSYRQNPPSRQLYVGNISRQADTSDLRKYFWRFGAIQKFRLFIERGFMFVIYTKQADAMRAKEHAEKFGAIVSGRRLNVNYGNVLPDENARLPSPRNLFHPSPRHSKNIPEFFNRAGTNMAHNMPYPMVGSMASYGAMAVPYMPAFGYMPGENGEMNVPYNMVSATMSAPASLYHPNSLHILQAPQGPTGVQQPLQTLHQTPQSHVYPAAPPTPATPGSGPTGTGTVPAPAANPQLLSPPNMWTTPGTPHGGFGVPGADYNMYTTPHNTPQTPHTPATGQYNPYSHAAAKYMMTPSMPPYDPYSAQHKFTAAQTVVANQQQGSNHTPQKHIRGPNSNGNGAGGTPPNTCTSEVGINGRISGRKDVPNTPGRDDKGGVALASTMAPMVPQTPRGDEAPAWTPIDPPSYMVPITPHAIPPSPGGPGLDVAFSMLPLYPPYAGLQPPVTPNAALVPMTPVSYLSPSQAQVQTIATQTQTLPNKATGGTVTGDTSSTSSVTSTPNQFLYPQQMYVPPFTQPVQGNFTAQSMSYAGLSTDQVHTCPTWTGGSAATNKDNFSQIKFPTLGASPASRALKDRGITVKRCAVVDPSNATRSSTCSSTGTSQGYHGGGGLVLSPDDQRGTTSVGSTRTQKYETGTSCVNMFVMSPAKSLTTSRFLASPASPTNTIRDKQAKKPMSKSLLPNAEVLTTIPAE